MSNAKSFILYFDHERLFQMLNPMQRGLLITAIFEYERMGSREVELDDVTAMAFECIRMILDRDRAHYEEICRQNSEKGKKGGRPRKNQKNCGFFEKAEKAYNDNDNDNENDNENNNVNVNGSENENDNDNDNDTVDRNGIESAAATPPASQTAPPPLSETDREVLKVKGIPVSYAEERWGRAWEFAMRQKREITELLEEWWQKDRGNHKKPRDGLVPKTYDLDEFVQAALSRSYDELRT